MIINSIIISKKRMYTNKYLQEYYFSGSECIKEWIDFTIFFFKDWMEIVLKAFSIS